MKEQLDRIEAKLDKVIKAMQEYDGLDEDFNEPYEEYTWKSINSVVVVEKENKFLNEEKEEPKPKRKYYHNKKKK
jgi:cell shape-determining protein MreC